MAWVRGQVQAVTKVRFGLLRYSSTVTKTAPRGDLRWSVEVFDGAGDRDPVVAFGGLTVAELRALRDAVAEAVELYESGR